MNVGIMGNIGAGKSTAATLLAAEIGGIPFFEPVVDNPYLDDFYKDMSAHAFQLQVYFLSHRIQHLNQSKKIVESLPFAWFDRTIQEDKHIFASYLHDRGFINERDWKTYCHIFDAFTPMISQPDIYFYLRAEVPTLQARIEKRGRSYEQNIADSYLEDLNWRYDRLAETLQEDGRTVVSINMTNLDISIPEQAEWFINRIKKHLGFSIPTLTGSAR